MHQRAWLIYLPLQNVTNILVDHVAIRVATGVRRSHGVLTLEAERTTTSSWRTPALATLCYWLSIPTLKVTGKISAVARHCEGDGWSFSDASHVHLRVLGVCVRRSTCHVQSAVELPIFQKERPIGTLTTAARIRLSIHAERHTRVRQRRRRECAKEILCAVRVTCPGARHKSPLVHQPIAAPQVTTALDTKTLPTLIIRHTGSCSGTGSLHSWPWRWRRSDCSPTVP